MSSVFLEQLYTKGYAPYAFPLTHRELTAYVEGPVFNLFKLPNHIREQIHFRLIPAEMFRGSEVGIFARKPSHDGDDKDISHYHPDAEERFAPLTAAHPEVRAWLDESRVVYDTTKQTIKRLFMDHFGAEAPRLVDSFFPEGERHHLYLRVIAYYGTEMQAKEHLDMSGCTLALAESDPGLNIGFAPEYMEEVVHVDQQAVFMPGLTFCDELSSRYPPAWHGVRRSPRAKPLNVRPDHEPSRRITRWAVVAFSNGRMMRNPTMKETNTPHPYGLQRMHELNLGQLALNFS